MDKNYLIRQVGKDKKQAKKYKKRIAARGIVKHGNKIAILFVSNFGYHKLPGGGLKNTESSKKAFVREVLEETGCKCEVKNYLGKTLEQFGDLMKIQTSYVYSGNVVGKIGKTKFEKSEIDEGFKLKWVDIDIALKVLNSDKPINQEGKIIQKRDTMIIKHYLKKLQTQ